MPAVLTLAPGVPGPGNNVGNPGWDVLITARAHIELGGRR